MKKKLNVIKNYLLQKPLFCAWQVTYRCNFKCNFCDYWKLNPKQEDEFTLEQFSSASEKLSKVGNMVISLAGGEPFLRKDLPEIVTILRKHHYPVVTTNGSLVTKDIAKKLFENGLMGASISIDYLDETLHDTARGIPSAFIKAKKALKTFSEARTTPSQYVNIMCVLKDDNIDQIEPLLKFAQQYNATVMVQPYCYLKTGKKLFSDKNAFSVSNFLLSLKKKYPNFKSGTTFLSKFDEFITQGIGGCRAGVSFFNIDNYGNVAICVEELDKPVGNILELSAQEIVTRLKEKNKKITCKDCWYNCRGEIESLYSINGFMESLQKLTH